MARLLNALRDELIAAGLVRIPRVAGPLPPMWLGPQNGVRAPGEGDNPVEVGDRLVVGAYQTGGIAPAAFGEWSIYPNVELRVRSKDPTLAEDLEQAITLRLLTRFGAGRSTAAPLLGGTLQVVECSQAGPLQLIATDPQGYEHFTTYSFQLYRPGT